MPPTSRKRGPVSLAWGARAIYQLGIVERWVGRRTRLKSVTHSATIDLVWDRQQMVLLPGIDITARTGLARWIDNKGLPELRKICEREHIAPSADGLIEHEADGYKIVGSPRRSYGYLYLSAWRVPS